MLVRCHIRPPYGCGTRRTRHEVDARTRSRGPGGHDPPARDAYARTTRPAGARSRHRGAGERTRRGPTHAGGPPRIGAAARFYTPLVDHPPVLGLDTCRRTVYAMYERRCCMDPSCDGLRLDGTVPKSVRCCWMCHHEWEGNEQRMLLTDGRFVRVCCNVAEWLWDNKGPLSRSLPSG